MRRLFGLLFDALCDHLQRDPAQVRASLAADFARSGQKGRIEFGAPRLQMVDAAGEANKRQRRHQRG